MDRGRVAEALISLFTSPDRAASIVGDFEEGLGRNSGLRYWRSVAVTAFALCFKSVVVAPLRALLLAIAGFSLFSLLYYTSIRITGLGDFVASFDPSRTDLTMLLEWLPSLLAIFGLVTASNFTAAVILGRLASTREANGCAPMIALLIAYWFVYPLVAFFAWGMAWPWIIAGALIAPFVYLIPLLAGAAVARHRTSMP